MRRLFAGVVRVALVGLLVATLAGFAGGLDWRIDLLSHFRLQYALGAVLLVAVGIALRAPGTVAAATLAGILNMLPTALLSAAPEADRPGAALRIVCLNLFYGSESIEPALAWLRREPPDVLVVSELTPRHATALRALADILPHVALIPAEGTVGIGAMARIPLEGARRVGPEDVPPVIEARLLAEGRTIRLLGVHPPAPVNAQLAAQRDRTLAFLRAATAAERLPTVVCGDFNTSLWSDPAREMMAGGRLRTVARFPQPSWPAWLPWPLRIPIDHVLVTDGLRTIDSGVGPHVGFDHLPVYAVLRLPAAP